MDKGEQDKAIEQADLAARTRHWSPTGHKNLALVHRRSGDLQKAIEHLSEAIKMGRGGATYVYDAYLERALCHIQLQEQQLAHQDLAMARKSASTLIRRCPNNFDALYTLAFAYLVQGDTQRAIRTIRRAQTTRALPAVTNKWAEETQRLAAIAEELAAGCTEFLDALKNPERPSQRLISVVRKLMKLPKRIDDDDMGESTGSRLEQWDSQADLEIIQDLIRTQQVLQDETIEVLEQGVRVSLPYIEGSIEKIQYKIQGEYFSLIIILSDGLLFSEQDVVFTRDFTLPVLSKKKLNEMKRTKDNTITQFVISIPYNSGSIKQV